MGGRERPQEAGTYLPLHRPPRGIERARRTDQVRPRALPVEDLIPEWHDTCVLQSSGLHGSTGRAGAQAKSEPDAPSIEPLHR